MKDIVFEDNRPRAAKDKLAEAETVEAESVDEPISVQKVPRDAFAKVRGELTEEEFATPAVSRMLLEKISDLQTQVREEKPFRAWFYRADKDKAVLEEKFKTRIASEVMFGVSLSAGSILISIAPTLPQNTKLPAILLSVGFVLFVGGVISRVIILHKK